MKPILIDASRYQHPEPTGVEVYTNALLDRFQRYAHEQQIPVCFIAPEEKKLMDSPYITQKVIPFPKMWTLLRLSLFCLLHRGTYSTLFVPAHILPLFAPKHSLVVVHDVAHKHFPTSYSLMQRMLLGLGMITAKKMRVLAVSKATEVDVATFYPKLGAELYTVPSGFTSKKAPAYEDVNALLHTYNVGPKTYFIYIGRLEEKKNVPVLIEAYANSKASQHYGLLLVGKEGQGYEKVQEMLRKYPNAHIHVTGFLADTKVALLLGNAKAFLFPSKYEGFGFPVLEALHKQVPVLCSKRGALPEVGGAQVRYIEEPLEETLRSSFDSLVEGLELRADVSSHLAKFSWDRVAKEVWELLLSKPEAVEK